jgi:hypothetical protein
LKTVASNTAGNSMALVGGSVYWADNGNGSVGSVMKCDVDGCAGAPTILASNQAFPSSVAVEGANMGWVQGTFELAGDVRQCTVGACSASLTTIASGQQRPGGPHNLAVDAASVYWGTFTHDAVAMTSDGFVSKAPIGGGLPATIAGNQNVPRAIVLDADNVYWINQGTGEFDGSVMKCAKSGCAAPATLAAGQQSPQDIAVDAANVYWSTYDDFYGPHYQEGSVLTCAIAGCPQGPTVLASGQAYPSAIVVDATNVYWVNTGSQDHFTYGAVMKCAIGGCGGAPTTIVSGEFSPFFIAVDDASVYWTRSTQPAPGELTPSTSIIKATPK